MLLGTGASCYISGRAELGFLGLCFFFWVFLFFGFWDVFGCDVGHFKALALIPIDVYVGGK